MIVWCEACGKREAWAKNLKHPICAECAVLAWQKLSEDANAAQQSAQRTATPEPVCTCKVTAESYKNCDAHGNRRR